MVGRTKPSDELDRYSQDVVVASGAPSSASSIHPSQRLSRRQALRTLTRAGFATGMALRLGAIAATSPGHQTDDDFLDGLERAAALYFWEAADPLTGLVKDRTRADGGPDSRAIASIAATGFGLTALCIADKRRYFNRKKIRERVIATLHFLQEKLLHEHGFYFHFINARTGERAWKSELSSIDTSLLLCGVLAARGHFNDREIRRLATRIHERVDWPWMLNGGEAFSHGWYPEKGFINNRWDHYSELMMIYLLGIGSPTHPVPPAAWEAFARPWFEYEDLRYINSPAPLFIHQYSHAWFDFRRLRDRHCNYFENSVLATRAHLRFCVNLQARFPHFSEDLWGITASDWEKGYTAWGGPPEQGKLDGTVVPCAAAGSLPFLPKECLRTLRIMRVRFGDAVWKRYGFIDAFNPQTGWFAPDVIGIDVGISMLMAENARSGFVWEVFMKNREARAAMDKVGFRRT